MKKFYFRFWCAIAPQHLVYMKLGGQAHENLFFLRSESRNRIEESISIKSYGSLKIVYRFSIFAQKMLTLTKLLEPEN